MGGKREQLLLPATERGASSEVEGEKVADARTGASHLRAKSWEQVLKSRRRKRLEGENVKDRRPAVVEKAPF